jgi:NhaP-type Na+/H+ or K+/H+ antiporter
MLVLGSFVLVYALVSSRFEKSIVTPPMIFVAFGMIACPQVLGLLNVSIDDEWIHFLAETTLILVLFIDASRIRLRALFKQFGIPLRMLIVGLPMTIALGGVISMILLPGWGIWEAFLLAAILAPTDAALGQAVVSHPAVPMRIRQSLNVESGLNDGLALPVVVLFAGLAAAHAGHEEGSWFAITARQLAITPVMGIASGLIGGALIHWGRKHHEMNEVFQRLSEVALALLTYQFAVWAGGNGFGAVYVAGMVFGNAYPKDSKHLETFVESTAQILVLLSFVLYGALMVWPSIAQVQPVAWVYALLALTVIRMLPVYASLAGSGLQTSTKLFLGWFGPRGLASILFGLLVLTEYDLPHRDEIFAVVAITVLLSIVLHGGTALPLAQSYGKRMTGTHEMAEAHEHPLRRVH